jgi:hypothetical protein
MYDKRENLALYGSNHRDNFSKTVLEDSCLCSVADPGCLSIQDPDPKFFVIPDST